MAELEAITEVQAIPGKSAVQARQYGRRFPLTADKAMILGRDETKMDIAIPEDDQISRFQAILTWEPAKGKLIIQTRPISPPDYPHPPANATLIFHERLKKLIEAPGGKCIVRRGESFWIGQTRFTLHSEEEYEYGPAEQQANGEETDDVLTFAKATGSLASVIRAAATEEDLYRQVLRVVLETLPTLDTAAVVQVPLHAHKDQRPNVIKENTRPGSRDARNGFVPSAALSQRAICERRSCLRCWPPAVDASVNEAPQSPQTTRLDSTHAMTPWAVCTPFQDNPRYALYITGETRWSRQPSGEVAQERIVTDLSQFQKITELLVGMIEIRLEAIRLAQQNGVIRRAWPQGLWKYLDDADELERMLAPKEMEITTLFCDLRNYSLFASQNATQLLQAQREVSAALSTMSGAIADRDGVVAGFRGDAVLGFWGWPKPHDKQVEQAARAAILIAGRLSDWKRTGRCGLGLTHGRAVAGRLGAQDLALVDLYGPVVNLTFRLESMTKAFGVPIIVSQEIAERIVVADPYGREMRTRPLGNVRAKGFPEPQCAYELYSAHTPSIPDWQLGEWSRTIELFTAGQWAETAELLKSLFPDDPAAHCLLRVMDATKLDPPPDWDGSFAPPNPDGS